VGASKHNTLLRRTHLISFRYLTLYSHTTGMNQLKIMYLDFADDKKNVAK